MTVGFRFLCRIGALASGCLVLVAPARSAPDVSARKAIELAYEKTSVATSLRFISAMYSTRAPDFVMFGLKGKPMDQRREEAAMAQLLGKSLSSKESVSILSFKQMDRSHAECTIRDVSEFLVSEPGSPKDILLHLETTSRDAWVLLEGRWLKKSSNVLSQTSNTKDVAPPSLWASPTGTPSPPAK